MKNETQQYFQENEFHSLAQMGFGLWEARGVECQAIVKKGFGFDCFVTLPKAWTECLMSWICKQHEISATHYANKQKCAHHTRLLERAHPLATGMCAEAWANRRVLCRKRRTILNHHSQIIVVAQNFLGFKHFPHANWQPMTTFNAEIMMRSIGTDAWDTTEENIHVKVSQVAFIQYIFRFSFDS